MIDSQKKKNWAEENERKCKYIEAQAVEAKRNIQKFSVELEIMYAMWSFYFMNQRLLRESVTLREVRHAFFFWGGGGRVVVWNGLELHDSIKSQICYRES